LEVSVDTAGGRPLAGKLVFVNNTVDTSTGTIALKAAFPNAAKTLWPGAFVHVHVVAGNSAGAVTLPPQSLLDGPTGRFVYEIDAHDRASAVPVTLLRVQDGVAIVSGLAGGERIVNEGQAGLKPGALVRIAAAPSAPASAALAGAAKDAR
jgi:RND family efflux transporter MFP subunit